MEVEPAGALKRLSQGGKRRSKSPPARPPRKDNSDPVIVCCKKFPDARTLDDIKAAIRVLKEEDSGELIRALLQEGPFFQPKPEGTGRFSKLSRAASTVSKAAKFSRTNSLARAASAASNKALSRAPSQSGASATNATAPEKGERSSLSRAESVLSTISRASSQALPANEKLAGEGSIGENASGPASTEQPGKLDDGAESNISRAASSASQQGGNEAQDNLSPTSTLSRSLHSRPASGRPGMVRISSVASIQEEAPDQARAHQSSATSPHVQNDKAATSAGVSTEETIVPSAFSAFDKPIGPTGLGNSSEGLEGSRIAALRQKKEKKCCNPLCKQVEDMERKFDFKCLKCTVKYCSKECQRAHWLEHGKSCNVNGTHGGSGTTHVAPSDRTPYPSKSTQHKLSTRGSRSHNAGFGAGQGSLSTGAISPERASAGAVELSQIVKVAEEEGAESRPKLKSHSDRFEGNLSPGSGAAGGDGSKIDVSIRGSGADDEPLSRLPSATHGLLKQVSSALERPPSGSGGVGRASRPLPEGVAGSKTLPEKLGDSGLPRTESASSVWERVGTAMAEEVDGQGFKSLDDRLEYFLTHASVMRVQTGQKVVAAGSTGVSGKRFFLVWTGSVSIQKPKPAVDCGDAQTESLSKPEAPEFSQGGLPTNINKATAPTRGPDRRIRLDTGPGGPAAESKAIKVSDASSRFSAWKKEVDRRRHGEPYVTQAEKEAAHRRRLEEQTSLELKRAHDAQASAGAGPAERVMGYVNKGGAFGEAECVLHEPFATSATGRHAAEAADSSDGDSMQGSGGTIVLLTLSMEDYLKLWPKRAKLVERAAWLHQSVTFLQAFDRTDLVRITCAEEIKEQRILPGQLVCRRGQSEAALSVVMNGIFEVDQPVIVDKALDALMRVRGQWLGPSDDWEQQQFSDKTREAGKEDGSGMTRLPTTKSEEDAKEEAETGGAIDECRATRALRRVFGFSGLHAVGHKHKSHPATRSRPPDRALELTVVVRRLTRGGAFGFWGMLYRGEVEPGNVTSKTEGSILTIPLSTLAKLLYDTDLRAEFADKEAALVGVWMQQKKRMSAVRQAQLVCRLSSAQAKEASEHVSHRMPQEIEECVRGSLAEDNELPPRTLDGLERRIVSRDNVPEVARAYLRGSADEGEGQEQQGPTAGLQNHNITRHEHLLPAAPDLEKFMQKTYVDSWRGVGRLYNDSNVAVLDYYEPVRHHHFKRNTDAFAKRKAPRTLTRDEISGLSFEPMTMRSALTVTSSRDVSLRANLSKLIDFMVERRSKAKQRGISFGIRKDVYLSMLRQAHLLAPRGSSKAFAVNLHTGGHVMKLSDALAIFDSHCSSDSHSSMQYMDEHSFKLGVEDIASVLDVQLPTNMSPIPLIEREGRAATRRVKAVAEPEGIEQQSSLSSPSSALKSQISAWREDVQASLFGDILENSSSASDAEAEGQNGEGVGGDGPVWSRGESLATDGDVQVTQNIAEVMEASGECEQGQDKDKMLSLEISSESLGSLGSAFIRLASSTSEGGSFDGGEDSFVRAVERPDATASQHLARSNAENLPSGRDVLKIAKMVDLYSAILPTPASADAAESTKKVKTFVGLEKPREEPAAEQRWKSQYQQYHETKSRVPLRNSANGLTSKKSGTMPIPLKSSNIGRFSKPPLRPHFVHLSHSLDALHANDVPARRISHMRELSLPEHELPFGTSVAQGAAFCASRTGRHKRQKAEITFPAHKIVDTDRRHHLVEMKDNPVAGDEHRREPEELAVRPSTSQGFVSSVRSETSQQGRISWSAHGKRAGGQVSSKGLRDQISVPSPLLGGWDRRRSPARAAQRYGRFAPAVSNESSFDSPLNSLSFGVSTTA